MRCLKSNRTGITNNLFQFQRKTTWSPLQIISLKTNALSHPSLPSFYALLEGSFREAIYFVAMTLLMISMPTKWVPFSLQKRKKSHGARSGKSGDFFCMMIMFFSAKNCRIFWVLFLHCYIEAAMICSSIFLVSPCPLSKAYSTGFPDHHSVVLASFLLRLSTCQIFSNNLLNIVL